MNADYNYFEKVICIGLQQSEIVLRDGAFLNVFLLCLHNERDRSCTLYTLLSLYYMYYE